jgi:hypothetical protein
MVSLFQFFDPTLSTFEETAIILILIWQERRLRKVEERLNILLGRVEGEHEQRN